MPMPAHKIGNLLTASSELRALSRRAQHLARLQCAVLQALPRPLARACRVQSLRSRTLVVAADNAAVAAKLRQLTPRLLEELRKLDEQVTGIHIEVQVAMQQSRLGKSSRKQSLDARAIADFERLAGTLEDSPLRRAVEALVRRNKNRVK